MSDDSPKRPPILGDHKKVGKRFVPPLVANIGPIQEVHWPTQLVPELLWLALLNERTGLHRGAELARQVGLAAHGAYAPVGQRVFAGIGSFYLLDEPQQHAVHAALVSQGVLGEIGEALYPFKAFYPDCPLNFLIGQPGREQDPEAMVRLKGTLTSIYDRTSKEATFAQANAVYIAFTSGMLKVASGLALANFPAIETYPDDEESRRVAGAVRAAINAFLIHTTDSDSVRWRSYFWKRGLELEPCSIEEQ